MHQLGTTLPASRQIARAGEYRPAICQTTTSCQAKHQCAAQPTKQRPAICHTSTSCSDTHHCTPRLTRQSSCKDKHKYTAPPDRAEFTFMSRQASMHSLPDKAEAWPIRGVASRLAALPPRPPRCSVTIFSSWRATLPSHRASMRWWDSRRRRSSTGSALLVTCRWPCVRRVATCKCRSGSR